MASTLPGLRISMSGLILMMKMTEPLPAVVKGVPIPAVCETATSDMNSFLSSSPSCSAHDCQRLVEKSRPEIVL